MTPVPVYNPLFTGFRLDSLVIQIPMTVESVGSQSA